jgi:D-aminopeptidase
VIAFSTAPSARRRIVSGGDSGPAAARRQVDDLTNDAMSALFQGVVEATEEAIYNSLFRATTVRSRGRTIEALPLDRVREILVKYNVVNR